MKNRTTQPVIIGAGPAGLTAGYHLVCHGHKPLILEADPNYVGGLSRTVAYKGNRFDIGGHRFFTKNKEIHDLWVDIIGKDEFHQVKRLSRIYYRGKFFSYPLKPFEVIRKIGPLTSARVMASYIAAKIRPKHPEVSLEDWVSNRFGRQLFLMFFKSYTEKVWGRPTNELSADWAAQRIQGLSLSKAVLGALLPKRGGSTAKTLTETFHYPSLGPGQMWESAAMKIRSGGGTVKMNATVRSVLHKGGKVTHIDIAGTEGPERIEVRDGCISSMPIVDLIKAVSPAPPQHVAQAAQALEYRDFLTVVLVLDAPDLFPDNWLYIHEPQVQVGRIQNYGNWSSAMVEKPGTTTIGLEYFCQAHDTFWSMEDEELLSQARREIDVLGLAEGAKVLDGVVVRMPKAYPVYDDAYRERVSIIRTWLETNLANLTLVGRNGMHKYNNQDHSMLTGLMAAKNMCGQGPYDVWNVHTDATYDEALD